MNYWAQVQFTIQLKMNNASFLFRGPFYDTIQPYSMVVPNQNEKIPHILIY
jgi:hypothetical protein